MTHMGRKSKLLAEKQLERVPFGGWSRESRDQNRSSRRLPLL